MELKLLNLMIILKWKKNYKNYDLNINDEELKIKFQEFKEIKENSENVLSKLEEGKKIFEWNL